MLKSKTTAVQLYHMATTLRQPTMDVHETMRAKKEFTKRSSERERRKAVNETHSSIKRRITSLEVSYTNTTYTIGCSMSDMVLLCTINGHGWGKEAFASLHGNCRTN